MTYLFSITANRTRVPFSAAKVDNLLPQVFIGVRSQTIVGAGQLLAKEALGAAMAAHGTSSGFMFRRKWLCCNTAAQGSQQQAASSEQLQQRHRGRGVCRSAARVGLLVE